MANDAIGYMRCMTGCGSHRMRVSLSKGGKVTVMCSACHFQGFARGQLADMCIRQAMTPVTAVSVGDGPAAVAGQVGTDAPSANDAHEAAAPAAGQVGDDKPAANDAPPDTKKSNWSLY